MEILTVEVNIMRFRKFVAVLLVMFFVYSAFGQEINSPNKYLILPSERVLLLIAEQPQSPVKIKNVQFLINADTKKTKLVYEIENISNKNIKKITYSKWHLAGEGGDFRIDFSEKPILPNEVRVINKIENEIAVKANKNEVDNLIGKNRTGAIVFLIKYVEFEDGTLYNDQETSEGFHKFANTLEVVNDKNNQ